MKRPIIAIVAILLLALMAYLPMIPTKFLLGFKPIAYHSRSNFSSLDNDEMVKVLLPVWKHEKYGNREGYPRFVSAYEYLWVYKTIGVLSVRGTSLAEREHRCSICSVVVDTGFTCGGLCGSGTTYYLALIDGEWKVEAYSVWVA